MEYDKKFLVLGNMNAITYKEIFPYIKDNKLWPGVSFNKTIEFEVPDHYDTSKAIEKDGKKIIKVPAISWWTNLDYPRRHQDIILFREYEGNEDKYPKYDNYDAINVDKVAEIPRDYKGVVGVPITFIGQWNPEQFEIVGLGAGDLLSKVNGIKLGEKFINDYFDWGGKGNYTKNNILLGYYDNNGKAIIPYMRILIQNKRLNPEIYGS